MKGEVNRFHHCALGGSGSTDPISNWTNIFSLESAELVAEIVKRRHFPAKILPTFLHEFMHHWCFNSAVGRSVAGSYALARRYAATSILNEIKNANDDQYWLFFHNIVRFRLTNSLLRPISEGLALFAEHDSFTGEQELVSEVLRATYQWFCAPEQVKADIDQNQPLRSLEHLLIRHRISEDSEQRKIQLLSQPLRYSSEVKNPGVRGGYLPGYLCVKNIRMTLLSRGCFHFLDPDFFLCYLRSYLFEDYGFVEKILAPIKGEEAYAEELINYFNKRLVRLTQETSENTAKAFEKWGQDQKHRLDKLTSPLVESMKLAVRGKVAADRLEETIAAKPPADQNLQSLWAADTWMLAQRHSVCVASFADQIKIVGERSMVETRGTDNVVYPVCSMPLLPGAPSQSARGRVECFISPATGMFAVVLSIGGKAVSCMHLREIEPAAASDFTQYSFDISEAERIAALYSNAIESALESAGLYSFLDSLTKNMETAAESVYRSWALVFVQNESLPAVEQTMVESGLFGLFSKDYSALEAISMLSLAASLNPSVEPVAKHLAERGHDLQSVRADSENVARRSGFPILHDVGEILLSFV